MFESVQNALERNLRAARAGELPEQDAPAVQGSGEIPFDFTIDKDGLATYSTSQYGAGKTIHCTGTITSPTDTFSVDISSSDGGGGHWDNVKTGDQIKFDLKTSFWHNTKITVKIKAAKSKNVPGHGVLKYTY
jgi:hypothetical protein